jgi:hypothetical protein
LVCRSRCNARQNRSHPGGQGSRAYSRGSVFQQSPAGDGSGCAGLAPKSRFPGPGLLVWLRWIRVCAFAHTLFANILDWCPVSLPGFPMPRYPLFGSDPRHDESRVNVVQRRNQHLMDGTPGSRGDLRAVSEPEQALRIGAADDARQFTAQIGNFDGLIEE